MSKAKPDIAPKNPEPAADGQDVLHMPIDQLRANTARACDLIAQAIALLPGLISIPEDDRTHSNGNFRDGESAVLKSVLTATVRAPQYFTSLADKDGGNDPNRFEPDLLNDRLERRDALATVRAAVAPLAADVVDTTLYLGELAKPPIQAAYQIGRAVAQHDPDMRTWLKDAIDFYSRPARLAARTRAAKKKGNDPTGGGTSKGT